MTIVIRRVELSILAQATKRLRELALAGVPNEVCGAIYYGDIVVQYPNILDNSEFDNNSHYAAQVDMKMNGKDLRAIWHSHPAGSLEPSKTDEEFMRTMVKRGHHFNHIIATPNQVVEYEAVFVDGNS